MCIRERVDPQARNDSYTEEDIRSIVDVSHEDGVIEQEEKEMINNVFDFGDATAKDIMVPKVDMSFLDVNASYGQTMEVYREMCIRDRASTMDAVPS